MRNTRNAERRKVFYYLEVYDTETGGALGRLGDISSKGLMLLSSGVLPLEKTYRMAVRLPENENFKKEYLEITAETRWQKPDFNPAIICIGCKLIDSSPEKDFVLSRLIEYYGFSEGHKSFRQKE